MINFKVGDKVKRILGDHAGMKVGDEGTVEGLSEDSEGFTLVFIKEFQPTGTEADGMDPINLTKAS